VELPGGVKFVVIQRASSGFENFRENFPWGVIFAPDAKNDHHEIDFSGLLLLSNM